VSKPYDATLKDLAALGPAEFLAEVDAPPALPVRLLNVDLSTVTAATDIVFGLGEPLQEVIHLDAQAGPDAAKHLDLLAYNGLPHRQYRVPVHSILLLLRSQARLNAQTGLIQYAPRPGRGKMDFGYEIVPLWEHPAVDLLAGGLGILPLAPLGRLPEGMSIEDGVLGGEPDGAAPPERRAAGVGPSPAHRRPGPQRPAAQPPAGPRHFSRSACRA
jgi:hypothetical protein